MSERNRQGPDIGPLEPEGRPRSPGSAPLPLQPSAEAHSPHAEDQGPRRPAPDSRPEGQALFTQGWLEETRV